MLKRSTLLLGLFGGQVMAQGPYWAEDFGGFGADLVHDVKSDAAGNIYVAGEFSLSITYDGQTVISAGQADAFVAKLDAAGALQWMVRAGGSTGDRALKVAVDGSGSVAVCGQFSGTADLFGTSFTSAGGTQDVFTAKLSAATGAASWVRTGTAALATDKPYGITFSPNGNVTVTGDFRGTIDFSGSTITSAYDNLLLAPGFDVFITSYSSTGALVFLQQGTATHADRGIDLVSDAASNLYVCGQFSDTITFDLPHNNTLTNASFLVKFDAAGVEQWFRRFGGATFNHVRDMQLNTGGNELLICGDLAGSMQFFDSSPNTITPAAANNYYVLRVDMAGEYIASTTLGSSSGVSGLAMDQRGSVLAVYGTFQCRFSALSTFYSGTGLFMAIGPKDLFITRHDYPSLALNDAQQFGGQKDKLPGGITSLASGALVFGGSYDHLLVFPSDNGIWGDVQSQPLGCPLTSVNDGITYCGDPNYGDFSGNNSAGARDGFVAKAFVVGREPYDVWRRVPGATCDRSELDPCIMSNGGDWDVGCEDTLLLCGPTELYMLYQNSLVDDLPFSFYENMASCGAPPNDSTAYTGWDPNFLWGGTETTAAIQIVNDGPYTCTMSTANGCFSWSDDVYVEFDPGVVVPLISDGLGVNVADAPTTPLECVDSTWIWVTNIPPGYSFSWTGGSTNDSLYVTDPGNYVATLTTPLGCEANNYITVIVADSGAVPPFDSWILAFDGPDTMVQCFGGVVSGTAGIQWYNGVNPVSADPAVTMNVYSSSGGFYTSPMLDQITWFTQAFGNGWVTISMQVTLVYGSGACSGSVDFYANDSVYVQLVPWANAILDGPDVLCPGDTAELTLDCPSCTSITWSAADGTGLLGTSILEDTAYVNQPGVYNVITNGTYGSLTCPVTLSISLYMASPPPLFIDPFTGIICPGETATVYTSPVWVDFDWTGPLGSIPVNNDTIVVTEPGGYSLIVTDADGCELAAGPITLDVYATPYINAIPDAFICPGDPPVTLSIVAAPGATIIWNAPLSGSSPTQLVSDTGYYSANVVSCGTPYTVGITIGTGLGVQPLIDDGPFTLCPGDSVQLTGPAGMAAYLWSPGGQTTQSIWVDAAGIYFAAVTGSTGCEGTTDTASVSMAVQPGPPTASGTTICAGETATLTATGTATIEWHPWPFTPTVLGTGGSYTTPPLITTDTVAVLQSLAGCEGAYVLVVIEVEPTPPAPTITGDTDLCWGQTLVLTASGPAGSLYAWDTPVGTGTTPVFTWSPTDPSGSGTYTCTLTLGDCEGPSTDVEVLIEPCDTTPEPPLPPFPNVFTPNSDGENDYFELVGFDGPWELKIFSRWGNSVAELSGRNLRWNGRDDGGQPVSEGVYYYEAVVQREKETVRVAGYIQVLR